MKTRVAFLIAGVLCLAAGVAAQKPAKSPAKQSENFTLKKQIFVDDIESQLSSVQVAGVRVSIRLKLAEWLWKNGRDDTGRAEPLAVKAIEELYGNEDEIVNPEWLKADLFTLLEQNAKETAERLKAKYFQNPGDDLNNALDLLQKEGGDKTVAERILKTLGGTDLDSRIPLLLRRLREMNSAELPIVLSAIVDADESGRTVIAAPDLDYILQYFSAPQVPASLQKRAFHLLLRKAREEIQTPTPESYVLVNMLNLAIGLFGEIAPELVPEARGLRTAIAAVRSRAGAAEREIEERIDASPDRLSATIEEAEKASEINQKCSLYSQAIFLAGREGKYAVAINLIEIIRDLRKDLRKDSVAEFYNSWTDQELGEIAKKALQKGDETSALKAIEKVRDDVRRGEAWRNAAVYFHDKRKLIDAEDAVNKAIKTLGDADRENVQRTYALIRLVPAVQRVNKLRLQEVIVLAAKAVNDLPGPGPDDKPGTPGFKKYVISAMAVNYNIDTTLLPLLRDNKTEASDLAGRIQKREHRILVDMLVGIDRLETAQKTAEKKAASRK